MNDDGTFEIGAKKRKGYLAVNHDRYKVHGMIKISVPYKCAWPFSLRPERSFVQIFKSFGLLKEIHIGDVMWDKEVFIMGDSPTIKELFDRYPDLKASVFELIKSDLDIDFNSYSLIFDFPAVLAKDVEETWQKALPHIEKIVDTLDLAQSEKQVPAIHSSEWQFALFVLTIAFMALSSIIYSFSLTDPNVFHLGGNLGFYGFVLGGLIGTSFIILWRIIKKLHSRSHIEFLLLFLFAPISFAVAGSSYFLYLNRALDTHKGIPTEATLVRKKEMRHKNGVNRSFHYTYTVPEEIKETSGPTFFEETVTAEEYSNHDVGQTRKLSAYPGHFGQPWIRKNPL